MVCSMDRPIDSSPYYKSKVSLRAGNVNLELAVGHTLFSTAAVDAGTRQLLKSLSNIDPPSSILDLGCGYGPIGLALKARFPQAGLHMVDRDALAIRFARANAAENGIPDVSVYGSVGYGAVDRKFDLLVSNVPGKAGDPVISSLITGARNALEASGLAAVVVVSPLADLVAATLQSAHARQILRVDGKNHSVFHFTFDGATIEEAEDELDTVHIRDTRVFSCGSLTWKTDTVWGIPEFDSLSYSTVLAIGELDRLSQPDHMLLFDPGQVHLPTAAALRWNPRRITLTDRDLLALQTSEQTLRENGYRGSIARAHTSDLETIDSRFDVVAGFLPEKVPPQVANSLLDQAKRLSRAEILLAGRSTAVTRLQDRATTDGLVLDHRARKHGSSAAVFRKAT